MLQLKLTYNTEHPYHKDVSIIIDDLISNTQDTYYFLLDDFVLRDRENWQKVRVIFHFLLSHWQTKINNLSINKTDYLPFDFSDQYIGCFKLTDISDNQVNIRYGFTTKFNGTTLCPSQVDVFNLEPDEFIISLRYPKSIITDKILLIQDIEVAKNNIIQHNG